ncbi:hypothetical protein HDU92_004958 [Lobulomyces angularis]|nr:hypothetical protein HDU92_004958 [Lobulomyces angularis]
MENNGLLDINKKISDATQQKVARRLSDSNSSYSNASSGELLTQRADIEKWLNKPINHQNDANVLTGLDMTSISRFNFSNSVISNSQNVMPSISHQQFRDYQKSISSGTILSDIEPTSLPSGVNSPAEISILEEREHIQSRSSSTADLFARKLYVTSRQNSSNSLTAQFSGIENTAMPSNGTPRNISSLSLETDVKSEGIGSGKPPFSYAILISYAIQSSPTKQITLNEIYNWITENHPFYKTAGSGWKNSIRHNLSLNKAFIRVPRPVNEPGKGAYWTIDMNSVSEENSKEYRKTRNNRARSDPAPYRAEPIALRGRSDGPRSAPITSNLFYSIAPPATESSVPSIYHPYSCSESTFSVTGNQSNVDDSSVNNIGQVNFNGRRAYQPTTDQLQRNQQTDHFQQSYSSDQFQQRQVVVEHIHKHTNQEQYQKNSENSFPQQTLSNQYSQSNSVHFQQQQASAYPSQHTNAFQQQLKQFQPSQQSMEQFQGPADQFQNQIQPYSNLPQNQSYPNPSNFSGASLSQHFNNSALYGVSEHNKADGNLQNNSSQQNSNQVSNFSYNQFYSFSAAYDNQFTDSDFSNIRNSTSPKANPEYNRENTYAVFSSDMQKNVGDGNEIQMQSHIPRFTEFNNPNGEINITASEADGAEKRFSAGDNSVYQNFLV